MERQKKSDVKVCLLGYVNVGKSSLTRSMKFGSCAEDSTISTIGAAFLKITSDPVYDLSLWDTAGGERFHSLMPMYVRNSEVCLAVFDCTKIETLEHAAKLHFHFLDTIADCDKALWILVGCKSDLSDDKMITPENIDFLKEKYNISHMPHFFISNTKGSGVQELKEYIYNHIRLHDAEKLKVLEQEKEKIITLDQTQSKTKSVSPFENCCQK